MDINSGKIYWELVLSHLNYPQNAFLWAAEAHFYSKRGKGGVLILFLENFVHLVYFNQYFTHHKFQRKNFKSHLTLSFCEIHV